jgi:putative ABC transport system permease protein
VGLGSVALANLRRHKGRVLVMALGLATAVAAFIAVASLVLSLQSTMDDRLTRYGASLLVLPASAELSLTYGGVPVAGAGEGQVPVLPAGTLEAIEKIPSASSIEAAVPVLLYPVHVSDGTLLAMGTDVALSARVKPWWRVQGALPSSGQELLLGANAAGRLGAKAGSRLSVEGRDYVVSGVLLETGGEEDNLVIMDRAQLATLAGRGADVNLIEVTASHSAAVDQLSREIAAAAPGATVSSVKKSLEFTAQANGALTSFGWAATALIVLISALIVIFTMLAAVHERQRELGVLRALGFRRRHVAGLLLREAIVVSLASAVLGVALGLGGAALAPRLASGLNLSLSLNPLVLVGAVALSVLLAVLSTLYPAFKASAQDPASALRSY